MAILRRSSPSNTSEKTHPEMSPFVKHVAINNCHGNMVDVAMPSPCSPAKNVYACSAKKMTRDRFRVMSLAPRRECPRNVVQMKEAMAAFFGSDSVAVSCQCRRSKIILVKALT